METSATRSRVVRVARKMALIAIVGTLLASAAAAHASAPAVSWEASTLSATDEFWLPVAYGGGRFVTLNYDGESSYSSDGSTWSTPTPTPGVEWNAIAFGDGRFVALSYGGASMWSTDGATWTLGSGLTSPTAVWQGIAYGNGRFVGVTNGGVTVSTDGGATWSYVPGAPVDDWYGVAYGGGTFVVIGGQGTTPRVMTSADGLTWQMRTIDTTDIPWGVAWTGSGFVITGHAETACSSAFSATSSDGATWAVRAAEPGCWESVAYGNGLVVASEWTDSSPRTVVSDDSGVTWADPQPNPVGGPAPTYRVAYGGGTFVAVGYGTKALSWTPMVRATLAEVVPRSGSVAGGTRMVITGEGLEETTRVTFGGVPATSISVISPRQIVATAPAHAAGAVDVTVTTRTDAVTLASAFTYVAPSEAATTAAQATTPTVRRLAAVVRCTGGTCRTMGTMPTGATTIRQRATRTGRASGVAARCSVRARRYVCTIRLRPGRWTITTTARSRTATVARSQVRRTIR